MSQNFNLNRYRLLFLKNLSENFLKYLLFFSGIILVLSFIFFKAFPILERIITIKDGSKIIQKEPDFLMQNIILNMLLIFGGALFTSSIFNEYGNKKGAISGITLPASITEKFWVAWTLSVKIFAISSLILYYLILWIVVLIMRQPDFHFFNLWSLSGFKIFIDFLFIQSIYFLGAIYFNKHHFIKTSLLIVVLGSLFSYSNGHLLPIIMGKDFMGFTQNGGDLILKNMVIYSRNHRFPLNILKELIFFVLAVIFWTASYFKLKEKEV